MDERKQEEKTSKTSKTGTYVRVVRRQGDDYGDDGEVWLLTFGCLWIWVFVLVFFGLFAGGLAGWGTYERVWWNGVCPRGCVIEAYVCS